VPPRPSLGKWEVAYGLAKQALAAAQYANVLLTTYGVSAAERVAQQAEDFLMTRSVLSFAITT
jgi:hypothetical protein